MITDQRLKILQMLENGTITKQQAQKLLEALGEQNCVDAEFDAKMSAYYDKFEQQTQQKNSHTQKMVDELREQIDNLKKQKEQLEKMEKIEGEFDCQLDAFNEEIEQLDEQIEELEDDLDDLQSLDDDTDEQFTWIPKPPKQPVKPKVVVDGKKICIEKLGEELADVASKLSQGAVKIADEIGSTFSSFDFGKVFSDEHFVQKTSGKGHSVVAKKPSQSDKAFAECEIEVKYTKSAFSFNGTFDASQADSIAKNLKGVLPQNVCQLIEQLVKEQFVGDYKCVCGNQVLKVCIE